MTNDVSLDIAIDVAVRAAREAGRVILDWRNRFTVREKGFADLVTEADSAAQSIIQAVIQNTFSDHDFLGEESNHDDRLTESDWPTWIVDPIDGTTNYVHDIPCYAVSIALMLNSELVLGVIYDPVRDEMYRAVRGGGAWLDDQRIHVSKVSELKGALLTVGFPTDVQRHEQQLERWKQLMFVSHGLRRTGSTAINLAYVAAGRFDGFFAEGLKVWDVAGGIVLVREAGGTVTSIDSSNYDPSRPDILATNGHFHSALQAALKLP
jgi:myo-inositol-1(or 4)-monophosphatase